jgi:hypothetical protein
MFWRRDKSLAPAGIGTAGNLTLSLVAVLSMRVSVKCTGLMPEWKIN